MDRQKLVGDLTGWVGNVSTSVLIVFVNKILMKPGTGYGFQFGTLPHSAMDAESMGPARALPPPEIS